MLVTVGDTLPKVRGFLQDEVVGAYRWSDSKLVEYLGEAALELVRVVPVANTVREALQLTLGSAHHDILPEEAIELRRVIRNMGPDGATPGKAITKASRDEMDRPDRSWLIAAGSTEIVNWMQDEDEPSLFYTYPPADAVVAAWVEVLYSREPKPMIYRSFTDADVDTANDLITIVGHGLEAGLRVVLPVPGSGGALPAPLAARTAYYTLIPDGDHLQLAATLGGAAINLTDQGIGTNYIDSVLTVLPYYKYPLQLHVAGSALLEDKPEADPPKGERYLNLFYSSLGVKPKAA